MWEGIVPVSIAERIDCNVVPLPQTDDSTAASLKGLRILVAQPDPTARKEIAWALEERGATVRVVGSAARAFKILREERPSMLIAEISMPFVDGYALIKAIRRLDVSEGGSIPAIALAADSCHEELMRSLFCGYQMLIPKTVRIPDLTKRIGELAARFHLTAK
jgi:CheY-like chemotaxis protein